jgi:TolB-like protein/DNA-binding winged helix-turn-helix (wHTH) protein
LPAACYKFDEFELDGARFELRRHGTAVKLERIPLELLLLLAEKNGEILTRQEIVERLWGKDVFVDTEHGINTAIRKIRIALREDIERPRFIQTVSGKGYRLVPEAKTEEAAAPESEMEIGTAAQALTRIRVRSNKLWQVAVISGLTVLLVAAIVFALDVAGMRDRVFESHRIGPIHSIAVLPLANLSGDASQDYYADGMTDEMITALAQNRSLQVVSRTSVMQYKGVNKSLHDIAQVLGVDGVLEGSVNRSANHVHVNLQLIYAPTDTHVWAQSYDRDLNSAMLLPEEVSQTIAAEAKIAPAQVKPQRVVSPEAHDAYLRGRSLWFNMTQNKNSRQYFEKAIQLQPDYAAAWGGLADSYIGDVTTGNVPPEPSLQKGAEAARKAVELDDTSAEAHHSLAAAYLFGSWDWRSAEKESLRAIELNPNLAEAYHLHSFILIVSQRPDDALREEKRAMELDPFAEPWALGHIYIMLGQFDAAINELHLRTEVQPNDAGVHFLLSNAYWFKGMWKESQEELEQGFRLFGMPEAAAFAHRSYEKGGEKAVERWRVRDTLARAHKRYMRPWDVACSYAYLGDKEKTLKFLQDSFRDRDAWLMFIQDEPLFDSLHSDPRYRAIVQRMGLPPAY